LLTGLSAARQDAQCYLDGTVHLLSSTSEHKAGKDAALSLKNIGFNSRKAAIERRVNHCRLRQGKMNITH